MTFKRPMLACALLPSGVEHTDENILRAMEGLRYPVLATLKKDGIRALRLNGTLLSRTLKPIPNKSIRDRSLVLPGGFDMELWNPSYSYDQVESIVMSREHELSHHIGFHLLDWYYDTHVEFPYTQRLDLLRVWVISYQMSTDDAMMWPHFMSPIECRTPYQLIEYFLEVEKEQGEGICFRTPNSPYKQGRSTLKEQYLIKLCRYVREEVQIVGFEEQMCNGNAVSRNCVGAMDRSSCQGNLIGKNTLGSLVCSRKNDGTKQDIRVGTGFDDKLRREIWNHKERYLGQMITIKYKPHGMKDKPRSPVFVGFRKDGQ